MRIYAFRGCRRSTLYSRDAQLGQEPTLRLRLFAAEIPDGVARSGRRLKNFIPVVTSAFPRLLHTLRTMRSCTSEAGYLARFTIGHQNRIKGACSGAFSEEEGGYALNERRWETRATTSMPSN